MNVQNNIITGTQAKLADQYAIETLNIPSLTLMETASGKVSELISKTFSADTKILIACGVGNNGADGVCIARQLADQGYCPEVWICGVMQKATNEFRFQIDEYKKREHNKIHFYKEGMQLPDTEVLIDAVFGIGLKRKIEGTYQSFVKEILRIHKKKVYAVDVPSGINADDGSVMGCAIKADVTITFGKNKVGLLEKDGVKYAGEVLVKEIGIPEEAYAFVREG